MNEPGLGNVEHLAYSMDRTVLPGVAGGSPEGTALRRIADRLAECEDTLTLNRPIEYPVITGCSLTLAFRSGSSRRPSLYAPVQERGRVRKNPACVLPLTCELRT